MPRCFLQAAQEAVFPALLKTLDSAGSSGLLQQAQAAASSPNANNRKHSEIPILRSNPKKTARSVAVSGTISTRRRVMDLEFPEPIPAPECPGRFGNLGF